MTYEILIGALSLVVLVAGVVKPLFDLNKNITILTDSVNQLKGVLDELKDRVRVHGTEIDNLNVKIENHEVRISKLEK